MTTWQMISLFVGPVGAVVIAYLVHLDGLRDERRLRELQKR